MTNQTDQTDLGRPVWYVAFGSNLYRPRLLAYLQGTAVPGSPAAHAQRGARDPSPPTADSYQALPYQLYFANHSKRWDGGAAFVDTQTPVETRTIGRRYLITWGQLEDIFAQENGATQTLPLSYDEFTEQGAVHGYDGWYDTVLFFGFSTNSDAQVAMATITSSQRHPVNPPSAAYAEVISRGLGELGYEQHIAAEYLTAAVGALE